MKKLFLMLICCIIIAAISVHQTTANNNIVVEKLADYNYMPAIPLTDKWPSILPVTTPACAGMLRPVLQMCSARYPEVPTPYW